MKVSLLLKGVMLGKRKKMASNISTSERQKKRGVVNKEVITSETEDSKEPLPESLGFKKITIEEMGIGDYLEVLKPLGVRMAISVNGATMAAIKTKLLNGEKRQQSLPSGDLLIVVLPKPEVKRKTGFAIVRQKE